MTPRAIADAFAAGCHLPVVSAEHAKVALPKVGAIFRKSKARLCTIISPQRGISGVHSVLKAFGRVDVIVTNARNDVFVQHIFTGLTEKHDYQGT